MNTALHSRNVFLALLVLAAVRRVLGPAGAGLAAEMEARIEHVDG